MSIGVHTGRVSEQRHFTPALHRQKLGRHRREHEAELAQVRVDGCGARISFVRLLGYSLAMINGEVIGIIGMHIGLGIWVCIYPNTPLQYVVQLLSHARIDLLIATL